MDEGGYSTVEVAKLAISEKENQDFSETVEDDKGIFVTQDNDGNSYYFRGATEDNYVLFADMLWRIIRIDGEGNIKLMLYSTDENATSYSSIGTSAFNTSYNDVSYSDYNISTVKTFVENWYTNNLKLKYQDYLVETSYCVDMEVNDDYSTSDEIYYGATSRLLGDDASFDSEPSLICNSSIDGIEENLYYVGLISSDEVSFAGGEFYGDNNKFYLYTGKDYWTGSAFGYDAVYGAISFMIHNGGLYNGMFFDENFETYYADVFPTISLSSSTQFNGGNGSKTAPYVVV